MNEFERLELRYKRLIRFDRIIWVLYAITALIPGYLLFTTPHARLFHIFGVLAILSVAWFGWFIDTRLIEGRQKKELTTYFVTGAFVLSRILIAYVGMNVLRSHNIATYYDDETSIYYWIALFDLLITTPIVYVLFFAAFYRMIYHVSVHYLLKINEIKKAEQDAPSNGG